MAIFDGSQIKIGEGAQAAVYFYNGYAYKVYNDTYPKPWIAFECTIQNEISKTNLPVVSYYNTDVPNIIRMDFIDGISLGQRIINESYNNGVEDLIDLQKMIHKIIKPKIPRFIPWAKEDIHRVNIDDQKRLRAMKYLESIPEGENLLHLDFHFQNVMYGNGKYYIIDWINARVGNPVFDYARSFVIMNEVSQELSSVYLKRIFENGNMDLDNFIKALYIMALMRVKENTSQKTLRLIERLENKQMESIIGATGFKIDGDENGA